MKIGIKDVLQQIRPFFILYLILLTACLIVKVFFTREEIYFAVNSRYSPWADFIMPYITDMGNGWTIVVFSVLLLLYSYRASLLMITTFLFTSLCVQIAKFFFDAPRPRLYFTKEISKLRFVKGVEILDHHSFPSGHTLTAFATGVLLTYLAKNKNWGILLVFFGALVGFSRMYLSEHFFEDVIGGSVMGVFLTIFWIRWLDSRKFIQAPGWKRGLLRG